MIEKIELKHYKAFDKASISIKPITILLGANSVGKSSIIQAILMLLQTAEESRESYRSPLKLYGDIANLGDPINIFRKFDTSSPVEFSITISSDKLKEFISRTFFSYIDRFKNIIRILGIKEVEDLLKNSLEKEDDFNVMIDKIIDSKELIDYKNLEILELFVDIKKGDLLPEKKQKLKKVYQFYNWLYKNIYGNNLTFEFSLKFVEKTKELYINHFAIKIQETNILSIDGINALNYNIYSDIINIDKNEIIDIGKYFNKNKPIFSCYDLRNKFQNDKEEEDIFISHISKFVIEVLISLKKNFNKELINHVSPLRAHPKRYYMLDKSKLNKYIDTFNGDEVAEAIKENKKLERQVNDWLFRFNLEVKVEEFKEIVHHIKVKQNELNLDISDVGFGISQILPIIIQGFLSTNNSLTIVEQPEIHLHPTMQAELADLFIDIAKTGIDKKLIIETHSEYLLKRLRRRISEGKIKPEDVSICLFHPQTSDKGAIIEELSIEPKGYFKWPTDFYSGDLLDDTLIFLQNQ